MKKYIIAVSVALLTIGGFVVADNTLNPVQAKDCGNNAVAKCGVWSVSEMRGAYNNDTTPGLRNIFHGMGLTSDIVNHATVKEGVVGKDGNVTVDGEVVATNASSAGRTIMSHTTQRVERNHGGTTYYESSTSDSFRSQKLDSYVFFDEDDRFIGAVIKDCGNPVKGKPTKPEPKPEPEPEKPNKIEVCRLKDKKYPVTIDEDKFDPSKHSMDPEDCEDEPEPEPEKPKKIEVCRLSDKKYPVTIREKEFNPKLHSMDPEDCEDEVVVPEPETPTTPEVPEELPQTGVVDVALSGLGLGSIIASGLAYVASRRNSFLG